MFKIFNTQTIIIFLPFFLLNSLIIDLAPAADYVITMSVHGWVYDQNSNNTGVAGIQITANVAYSYHPYIFEGEPYGSFQTYETQMVTTDAAGYFNATFEVNKFVYDTIDISAEMQENANWLLASTSINPLFDTGMEYKFYVVAFNDDDGNGIHDAYEFELAQKFAPELQPNRSPTAIFPEPVDIMAGPNNSLIYVTLTTEKHKLKGPWRLDLVDCYNQQSKQWEKLCPEYYGNVGKSLNYSNLFNNNPVEYYYLILRVWQKHGLERGSVLVLDSTVIMLDFNSETLQYNAFKLWYHFDWKDGGQNVESDWWTHYNIERKYHLGEIPRDEGGPKFDHTIYADLWKDSGINRPVIQYWFFYPYDDFVNDHEGDWEHINVIMSSQIPDEASIEKVQYYFHEHWTEKSKEFLHYADDPIRNHPMVYIGGNGIMAGGVGGPFSNDRSGENSGGSYPYGYHVYSNVADFGGWSYAIGYQGETVWSTARTRAYYSSFTSADDEPNDGRGLELLKDRGYFESKDFYLPNNHPEYSWFNTNIRFGEPRSEFIAPTIGQHFPIDSKSGPSFKDSWKKAGSSAGYTPWEGNHERIRPPH